MAVFKFFALLNSFYLKNKSRHNAKIIFFSMLVPFLTKVLHSHVSSFSGEHNIINKHPESLLTGICI